VRTSPGDTPSNQFFNAFVPYPSDLDEPVKVTLGNSWQIQNLIPESKGYFIYEGTTPWPECDPNVTWIVFNTAVSIDPSDFAKMRSKGKGGYGVKIDKTTRLDCYEKANTRECLASMGNSPLNLASPYPQANAKLVIRNGKAYLVAITDIEKDCEIFYNYGSIYQMI
jgi:hypothetical protein